MVSTVTDSYVLSVAEDFLRSAARELTQAANDKISHRRFNHARKAQELANKAVGAVSALGGSGDQGRAYVVHGKAAKFLHDAEQIIQSELNSARGLQKTLDANKEEEAKKP